MIEEWLWGFEVWVKASEVPAEPEMSYGIELIANKWSGVLLYRSKFDMTLYLIWCWREGIWAPSHTAVKYHLIIFDSNLAINIKILKRSKLLVLGWGCHLSMTERATWGYGLGKGQLADLKIKPMTPREPVDQEVCPETSQEQQRGCHFPEPSTLPALMV